MAGEPGDLDLKESWGHLAGEEIRLTKINDFLQ